MIPSEELSAIAGRDVYGHLKFEFHPGATTRGRMDAFRRPTSKLPEVIASLLSDASVDTKRSRDDWGTTWRIPVSTTMGVALVAQLLTRTATPVAAGDALKLIATRQQ